MAELEATYRAIEQEAEAQFLAFVGSLRAEQAQREKILRDAVALYITELARQRSLHEASLASTTASAAALQQDHRLSLERASAQLSVLESERASQVAALETQLTEARTVGEARLAAAVSEAAAYRVESERSAAELLSSTRRVASEREATIMAEKNLALATMERQCTEVIQTTHTEAAARAESRVTAAAAVHAAVLTAAERTSGEQRAQLQDQVSRLREQGELLETSSALAFYNSSTREAQLKRLAACYEECCAVLVTLAALPGESRTAHIDQTQRDAERLIVATQVLEDSGVGLLSLSCLHSDRVCSELLSALGVSRLNLTSWCWIWMLGLQRSPLTTATRRLRRFARASPLFTNSICERRTTSLPSFIRVVPTRTLSLVSQCSWPWRCIVRRWPCARGGWLAVRSLWERSLTLRPSILEAFSMRPHSSEAL